MFADVARIIQCDFALEASKSGILSCLVGFGDAIFFASLRSAGGDPGVDRPQR